MKVLHILYSGLGGHGNVFFSMVEANASHEIEMQALFNGIEEPREEYINRSNAHGLVWDFVKKEPGLDPCFYKKLYKTIVQADADILFLHGGGAMLPAWLAKKINTRIKKIIVRETQANHLKTKKDWFYLASSMLLANDMVFLSDSYKKEVIKKLPFLFRKKHSFVIPNGISLTKFYRTQKKRKPHELAMGMQSRLVGIKDHRSLLEAVRILQKKNPHIQYRLLLAGDGDTREGLQEYAKELEIDNIVEFTGMLPETELVSFLHKLDVYIHASFGETMSTALMQALATGVPVIASNVPGINNMLTDRENALLVPVKNAGKLSAAIETLQNNEGLANQLAENGYHRAATQYSNTTMFAAYKKIFSV